MRTPFRKTFCVVFLCCSALMTACLNGPTDTCRVGAISVAPTAQTVILGSSFQANAYYTKLNCADEQSVTWSSDNTAVAIVSSKGLITGVGFGGPVIVRATLGGSTATVGVTVIPAPIIH